MRKLSRIKRDTAGLSEVNRLNEEQKLLKTGVRFTGEESLKVVGGNMKYVS